MEYEINEYPWNKDRYLEKCIGTDTVAVIPDNVARLSAGCFNDCPNLKKVVLPEAFQSNDFIAANGSVFALHDAKNLEEIEAHPDNKTWKTIDGILFYHDETTLCVYPCAKQGYFNLPEKCTRINRDAFLNCHGLTGIRIHQGIKKIEEHTFRGCSNLKEVIIEKGVERIYESAFQDCNSLTNLVIGNSVDRIFSRAFKNCTSLIELIIPGSIVEGGGLGSRTGEGSFSNCTGLERVQFEEGVQRIGDYAFEGCENLVSISLPKSIQRIGKRAFYKCKNLKEVIIPDELIKNEALFEGFNSKVKIISAKDGRVLREPETKKKATAIKSNGKTGPTWALCETLKSYKQCSVALKTGKTYAYASNYAIKPQDIAIIGTKLKGTSAVGATSGQIGKISEIAQSFSADRAHLLALDFAFTSAPTTKTLKNSAIILQEKISEANLSNDPNTFDNIVLHPITLMVRKILAALTILAYPENAESVWTDCATVFLKDGIFKNDDVEQIKEICRCARFGSFSIKLWEAYFPELEELKQKLQTLEQNESIRSAYDEFELDEQYVYFQGKRNKAYREYLTESTLAGAINIMVQAEMNNLLDVLLKVKPKLKGTVNEIKALNQQ